MTNSPEVPISPPAKPTFAAFWTRLLQRHRWLPFVLPFAVFILSGFLEPAVSAGPAAEESSALTAAESSSAEPTQRDDGHVRWGYPLAYTLRIALTGLAILLVLPSWRAIPWRCSWLAVAFGLFGGLLWIGICRLKIEDTVLTLVGLGDWTTVGDRPQFDPYEALGATPALMVAFLTVRLVGLTLLVPLIEEFFLRGFLIRFIEKPDWWTIELGSVGRKAAITATLYGVLAHPAEPLAAALWFSLITLLYVRTRNIWDCVVAHGVTNGMMGLYILAYRDWTLW